MTTSNPKVSKLKNLGISEKDSERSQKIVKYKDSLPAVVLKAKDDAYKAKLIAENKHLLHSVFIEASEDRIINFEQSDVIGSREGFTILNANLLLQQIHPKYPLYIVSKPRSPGAEPLRTWRILETMEGLEQAPPYMIKTPHLLCSPFVWRFRRKYLNTVVVNDSEWRRGAGIRTKDDPDLSMFFQTGDLKYFIEALRRWKLGFLDKEFAQFQIRWLQTIIEYSEWEEAILPNIPPTFVYSLSPKVWRELLREMEECLLRIAENKEFVIQAKHALRTISPLLVPQKSDASVRRFDYETINEFRKKLFDGLKEFLSKGTTSKLRKGRFHYRNDIAMKLDLADFLRQEKINIKQSQINSIIRGATGNTQNQKLGPRLSDVVFQILACICQTTPLTIRKICSHKPQTLKDFLQGKKFADFLRLI